MPRPAPLRVLLGLAGLALVAAGVALARRVEPGVRVEEVRLGRVAALRIGPERPAPDAPRALLAHGFSASKETMFRLGEALASAGFECLSFDFAGHGATPGPPPAGGRAAEVVEAARALGGPEVLAGHSMGAYASGAAVALGRLRPRLLLSLGALPEEGARRELLLLGAYDELLSPAAVRAAAREREGARAVISPRSDHVLEPFDPALIDAAVAEACAVAGLPPPRRPHAWLVRLLGCALLLAGTLLLLGAALRPVGSWPAGGVAGALAAVALIAAAHLALGRYWLGTAPTLARLPQQLAAAMACGLASALAARAMGLLVRSERVAEAAGQVALALALVPAGLLLRLAGAAFLGMACWIGAALALAVAALASGVAWRATQPSAAHAAFGVLLGWALGQWVPLG